jgi:hypothetical protein
MNTKRTKLAVRRQSIRTLTDASLTAAAPARLPPLARIGRRSGLRVRR